MLVPRRLTTSLAICLISCLALPASASPTGAPVDKASASPAATTKAPHAQWRPNGAVHAIAVSRTRVFIGGDFTRLTNTGTHERVRKVRVAAFNRKTGALVRGFTARVNGRVRALSVFDSKLVMGGDFTKVGGRNRQHLAAVRNGDGRVVRSWHKQVNGPVLSILALKDRVYVGGNFNQVDATTRSKLFALNRNGQLVSGWPIQTSRGTQTFTDGGAYALAASPDGRSVIVGGTFHTFIGKHRTYLGEVARRSGKVRAWHPTPACFDKCFVLSLDTSPTTVFAGIGGPGGHATAYRLSNASTEWSVHTSGDISAVARTGSKLLIGGHFAKVAGRNHRMFAQLVASSGAVTRRRPSMSGELYPGVLAIEVRDNLARIGGAFDTLAGQRRYAVLPS